MNTYMLAAFDSEQDSPRSAVSVRFLTTEHLLWHDSPEVVRGVRSLRRWCNKEFGKGRCTRRRWEIHLYEVPNETTKRWQWPRSEGMGVNL